MNDNVQVRIELGRGHLSARDTSELPVGSVLELDAFADDGVDVYVDGQLYARGKAVVAEGNFAVRIEQVLPAAGGRA
ncbi:MAG: FliM/FliN family flagellar motor C-terminal domain-containing protein [Phycisphaerae bacterium]|jgi:flagellar motor switch protein FliN/FliY